MKVTEIMTARVISVSKETTVREVAAILDQNRISGVPVIDRDGHILGVVSEFDLIAKPQAVTAGDAMTRDVVSVMEETDVEQVRSLLVSLRIKRVPVLRAQRVVGIVSRADLVREIALTWMCQVCGHHERGASPPHECPKCGVPSGFYPAGHPPVGEGSDVGEATCFACGQPLPPRNATN